MDAKHGPEGTCDLCGRDLAITVIIGVTRADGSPTELRFCAACEAKVPLGTDGAQPPGEMVTREGEEVSLEELSELSQRFGV